jgi:hypothetical protein
VDVVSVVDVCVIIICGGIGSERGVGDGSG